MNTDVEDLLREGMERLTADLRAPAGLAGQIARRRRRRRLALCSVTGAAAALTAGGVALAVVVVPSQQRTGIELTADVVKRVSSALTAADPGDIAQMSVTTSSASPYGGKTTTTTAEEWSYGDQWRSVTYSSPGHPLYDEGYTASASSSAYTLANYSTRSWTKRPGLGRPAAAIPFSTLPASRGCRPAIGALPLLYKFGLPGIGLPASSLPSTVARSLRTAVSCGTLTVTGRQSVDGIEAIKLTSRPGSFISETIWVSPSTYLPVRVVVRSASGASGAPGAPAVQQTADITWLSPTAQNLAELTVPIPAGFRQVSLSAVAAPTFKQISPALLPRPKAFCLMPAVNACGNPSFPVGGPPLGSGYR
ncbi:MAG: hypothetical protein ACRDPD_26560 [Streptosporangiaceae bacterium]